MNRLLLLLGVAALFVAAPASAQYVFLDTNNDADCTTADALTSANTSVDIWFVTNANKDTSPATCVQDGSIPLSFNGYQIILSASGSGSVTYGAFTNAQPSFDTHIGPVGQGGTTDYIDAFISGTGVGLAPGKWKAGTLAITVTGSPVLSLAISSSLKAGAYTEFASDCAGVDFDNTMKLGPFIGAPSTDFTDACGTSASTPTKVTTWGAIKNLYK